MSEKKVVIRLNYGGEAAQTAVADEQPEEIVEWDYARILMAVFMVLALLGALVYFWKNGESDDVDSPEPVVIQEPSIGGNVEFEKPEVNDRPKPPRIVVDIESDKTNADGVKSNTEEFANRQRDRYQGKNPDRVFADERVVGRSQFTSNVVNKEPVDRIDPLFVALPDQAIRIHYFVELNNMKGEFVTQNWRHRNKLVWKKRIGILGNRWRIAISKLISSRRLGDWEVTMENAQGEIISREPFEVLPPLN